MSKKVLKLLRGDQGEPERTCDITNLVADIPDVDYLKKNKKNGLQWSEPNYGTGATCTLFFAICIGF